MKAWENLTQIKLPIYLITLSIVGMLMCNSCVTTRKTTLLQDYRKSDYPMQNTGIPPETYLIKPNDNLYIRVSTLDPAMSELFNASPGGGGMLGSEASVNLLSYPVHQDGTVDMPYVGSVPVAGKTLVEAKDTIESVLVDYVKDADITVRLVNNYISILGEVNQPGLYPIYKDQLNIFQALSMAGGLADFGNRYKMRIVRQKIDGSEVKEFDLTDQNIINSEFYYVMPNDVIYAKPLKGKFLSMSQSRISFILSVVTTGITTFILVQNYMLLQQPR